LILSLEGLLEFCQGDSFILKSLWYCDGLDLLDLKESRTCVP